MFKRGCRGTRNYYLRMQTDFKSFNNWGRCIERGVGNIVLYVGGNLVIGKRAFSEVETLFLEMGFDRVFSPTSTQEEVFAEVCLFFSDRIRIGVTEAQKLLL